MHIILECMIVRSLLQKFRLPPSGEDHVGTCRPTSDMTGPPAFNRDLRLLSKRSLSSVEKARWPDQARIVRLRSPLLAIPPSSFFWVFLGTVLGFFSGVYLFTLSSVVYNQPQVLVLFGPFFLAKWGSGAL